MSAVIQKQQFRCTECGLRLADYENAIKDGLIVIVQKCRKCGTLNRVTLGPESS